MLFILSAQYVQYTQAIGTTVHQYWRFVIKPRLGGTTNGASIGDKLDQTHRRAQRKYELVGCGPSSEGELRVGNLSTCIYL